MRTWPSSWISSSIREFCIECARIGGRTQVIEGCRQRSKFLFCRLKKNRRYVASSTMATDHAENGGRLPNKKVPTKAGACFDLLPPVQSWFPGASPGVLFRSAEKPSYKFIR